MKYVKIGKLALRARPLLLGLAVAGLWSGSASAFEIETGNEDVSIRWDNTVRYNAGWRMDSRNKTLGDTWSEQAGEYKFDKGDMVTNRFDLLSEFDIAYKKVNGFRVSVAAWNDFAYDNKVKGNPAYQANPPFGNPDLKTAYPGNKYTHNVDRYYTSSAEFLDAFVFFRAFEQDDAQLDVKIGRHTTVWGESLFSVIHGVSYSQGPIDFRKGMATPGVEGKELFLPLNQISAHAQITDKVSVNAQYYLEWAPYRIYEGGTYFTYADPFFQAGTTYLGTTYIGDSEHGQYKRPGDRGSWGVNLKWNNDFGNLGFYYRKFDDKVQGVVTNAPGQMTNVYAEDVKLFGVSLSKQMGGVAYAGEIVYRKNTALNSRFANNFGNDPTSGLYNSNGMARGDTWHALVNAMAFMGKNPVFDSAVLLAELTYSRLDKVYGSTKDAFWGVGYNCPDEGETQGGVAHGKKGSKWDGCSTKDAWGLAVNFTPTWYQVFPLTDISMPMHYDRGLKGNSPVPFGGNEGSGSWSIGVSADYKTQYVFTLAWTDYFGKMNSAANLFGPSGFFPTPGIGNLEAATTNGGNAYIKDRGWLSFTFKTTF
jgi:hypothetical protein